MNFNMANLWLENGNLFQTVNNHIDISLKEKTKAYFCVAHPLKAKSTTSPEKGQTVCVVLDDISEMKNILFTSVLLIWLK